MRRVPMSDKHLESAIYETHADERQTFGIGHLRDAYQ